MHNRTDGGGPIWDDPAQHGATACCIKIMFTIAVLVTISAVLFIYQTRVAGRGAHANLGWMSAQWLSEYRASHPS